MLFRSQRILETVRSRLKQNQPVDRLILGIAGWMRYVCGFDENFKSIDIKDPLRDKFQEITKSTGLNASQLVPALLSIEAIFGKDLLQNDIFLNALTEALNRLITEGTRKTLAIMKECGR